MNTRLQLVLVLTFVFVLGNGLAEQSEDHEKLPLDDLRTFAEVFGRIKSDYVESVDAGIRCWWRVDRNAGACLLFTVPCTSLFERREHHAPVSGYSDHLFN